jgi:hypothetical protein
MAPSNEVPNPSLHDEFMTEIVGLEFFQYQGQLRAFLDTLCLSPIFRSSPKSCEFIRHVVHRSLEGNIDELKERLIGMSLLGRDASYDTSTDSGVRVRANDVRKRLVKFNESEGADQEFCIMLPTGTYVPRFFRIGVGGTISLQAPPEVISLKTLQDNLPETQPHPELPLSLFQLAVPTLAAIFLCIICMRWQLSQENLFTNFWHEIFQGDQAFLYLTPSHVEGKEDMVAIRDLNEAAPLLDLVAQFHRKFAVVSGPSQAPTSSQMSLYIGLDSTSELQSRNFGALEQAERFHLVSQGGDRMVVDSSNRTQTLMHHAALLTIVNGRQRSVYIDGTDDKAIRSLVNRLCDQTSFPAALADSFRPGTITQAVFPVESYAKGILDHQPLTRDMARDMAALERLP